jgi:uncharacterized protein (DUF433 family)
VAPVFFGTGFQDGYTSFSHSFFITFEYLPIIVIATHFYNVFLERGRCVQQGGSAAMKFNKKAGIGILIGVLLVGAVATVAFAQSAGGVRGKADMLTGDGDDWGPPGPRDGRGFGSIDTMHAAIADALGISVEALDEALADGVTIVDLADELGVDMEAIRAVIQAARDEALTKAVEDGLITQEQADRLRERMSQFALNDPRFPKERPEGFEWPARDWQRGADVDIAIADALGLTVDELEAAREDGKTLAALAEAAGVTLGEVQDAIQAVRASAIQQAVEDGKLTQEQADRILNRSLPFGERDSRPESSPLGRGGLRGPRVGPDWDSQ